MLRLAGAALLSALAACVSSQTPGASTPAADTTAIASPVPPVVDLSGGWATGSINEPPPGPVEAHPACAYNPAVWLVEQSGNLLKTWSFRASFNQGIVRAGSEPARIVPTPGTISGDLVVITDSDARIVARYDTVSGHLRGSRNGEPFWAARQMIIRREACPGIP